MAPVGFVALRAQLAPAPQRTPKTVGIPTDPAACLSLRELAVGGPRAEAIQEGDAFLGTHISHLTRPTVSRAFDSERPLRVAAFAGFVPERRAEWRKPDAK